MQGTLEVASQSEALRRIKEMGLYPTRVAERARKPAAPSVGGPGPLARLNPLTFSLPLIGGRVKPRAVTVLTRQLAT